MEVERVGKYIRVVRDPGTAAVQDVMDGLVDIAIGPSIYGMRFLLLAHITYAIVYCYERAFAHVLFPVSLFFYRGRLKMTSFTMPIRKL